MSNLGRNAMDVLIASKQLPTIGREHGKETMDALNASAKLADIIPGLPPTRRTWPGCGSETAQNHEHKVQFRNFNIHTPGLRHMNHMYAFIESKVIETMQYCRDNPPERLQIIRAILEKYPPVLGIGQIVQMALVTRRTDTLSDDSNTHEIRYTTIDDLRNAVEEARALGIIQRSHLGNEMALLIETISTPGFEPSPGLFDAVVIKLHSVPILKLTNSGECSSYSLVLEIDTLRKLAAESAKYSVDQALERASREMLLQTVDRHNRKKLMMVAVLTTGIVAVVAIGYQKLRHLLLAKGFISLITHM